MTMATVRVLSLTQPWATLLILGEKHYETRSWETTYRGPLVIHASKTFPRWARELCAYSPFMDVLQKHHLDVRDLPLGHALGTVVLEACVPTGMIPPHVTAQERAFGDFSAGRYAFRLMQPRQFGHPVPLKGHLGIFVTQIDIQEDWYT